MSKICNLTLGACLAMIPALGLADFVPDDQIISDPNVDLPPPEFDEVGNRMVWQDRFNNMWLADVDPVTGDITPADGRGLLLDTGLAPVGQVGNTPRFTYGADESVIIYTTQIAGDILHLAKAVEDSPGSWTTQLLAQGDNRWRANGAPVGNPDAPRMVYNRLTPTGDTVVSWRDVDDPATEGTASVMNAQGGRYLGTERALLAMNRIDDTFQVMQVDIDSGLAEQITFDGVNKLNPFIWWAPEYQDLAFVAMLNFTSLGIYTRVEGVWTQVHSFAIPSSKPMLSSPEAFVSNGKSYISLVTADELGSDPFPGQPIGNTEIWLAGIDPDAPFFRRIDDPSYEARRSEPEPYELTGGPIIYYTERDSVTGTAYLKRADTGLGADYGYDNTAYGGAWASMHRDGHNSACVPFDIADAYTDAYQVLLPNAQFVRSALGPQGNLYFPVNKGGGNKALVAIDTDTGTQSYEIAESVTTSKLTATNVLIDSRGQYYVPANEALTKFDSNGNVLWQIPSRGLARSAQFLPDGNLLTFTWNGWSNIVDPDDGAVLRERNMAPWRDFPLTPRCLSGSSPTSCAYVNAPAVDASTGRIFVTQIQTDGDTTIQGFAYDPVAHTLGYLWRGNLPVVPGISTSPVLTPDGSRIYVQDGSGNLVAVDTATGNVAWQFPLGFVSENESPPVLSAGGYIMPGGRSDASPAYNFIGLVEDLGNSAQWVFQDSDFSPVSSAAAAAGDRFVLAGREAASGNLSLLVVDPQGIVSTSPWGAGPEPTVLEGLTVREDGWVFVQTRGLFSVKAFSPVP